MGYLVTLAADSSIQELFHTEISPLEIIPPEAVAISDADGDALRLCSCFGDYKLINGSVEAL